MSAFKKGGAEKYHERNRQQKKLFARDRLKLLLDDGKIEFEDGMFAGCQNPELPADGIITGFPCSFWPTFPAS